MRPGLSEEDYDNTTAWRIDYGLAMAQLDQEIQEDAQKRAQGNA